MKPMDWSTEPTSRQHPAWGRRTVRVMYYSHDTFGLGHLRRTLAIARYLKRHAPFPVSQLIVTGSSVAGDYVLPDDADYVKLPSVVKVGAGAYESRSVAAPYQMMHDMRAALILEAARHFRPDVLLVDHAPAGLQGEVVPTLRHLARHSPHTRLVLGLRDILDEPDRVRRAWRDEGAHRLLDEVYHQILVYGQPDVYDVVAQYDLSAVAAAKTHFVGYLGREADGPAHLWPEPTTAGLPLVVLTAGGGGDGYPLLAAALAACQHQADAPHWRCLAVTGPLMSARERAELVGMANGLPHVQVLEHVQGLPGTLAAADVVVTMGGYNTVCEVLSLGRPAIVVPRVQPRREQLLRARALAGAAWCGSCIRTS